MGSMPAEMPAPTAAPELAGRICGLVGNLLHGWVWSPREPQRRWAVAVHHDAALIGLAQADQYHPDAPGDGCHGFSLAVPDELLCGGGRLQVRLANTGHGIGPAIDLPATGTVTGIAHHSRVTAHPGLVLAGWLVDPDEPHRTLEVQAWEGGRLLASARPDRWIRHRGEQLEGAFRLKLPLALADGETHTLVITDSEGRELGGSPVTVQEWVQGAAPWLQARAELREPERALLLRQLARYETLLPSGVDLSDYEAWSEVFGEPDPVAVPIEGQVGVLLLGRDPEALERTRSSLHAQLGVGWHAWQVEEPRDGGAYEEAVRQATVKCRFLTQIHVGDTLPPHALAVTAAALEAGRGRLVYSDHDAPVEESGRRAPLFKPAWDRDRFWCQDYVGTGLCMILAERFRERRPQGPGDFSYCAAAGLADAEILHLPWVLRHHGVPAPGTQAPLELVQARLHAHDPHARLDPHQTLPGVRRLTRRPKRWPDLTLIIPTRDGLELLRRCVESLLAITAYPGRWRIMVVDNQSTDAGALGYFEQLRRRGIQVLPHPHPFNYATIHNRAVQACESELIGLVNNDIECVHSEWLTNMVGLLMREDTGAVGAKLLWPNGMVQHGGVVGGFHGLAAHVGNAWQESDSGYGDMNHLTQRFSAVTAACLLLRRADYLAVGGMDERAFPVAFNDVDLCLKLRRRGQAVVWTPEARLIHAESASRGRDDAPEKAARAQREMRMLRQRWSEALLHDPSYNPNLSLDATSGSHASLALPPRPRKARNAELP